MDAGAPMPLRAFLKIRNWPVFAREARSSCFPSSPARRREYSDERRHYFDRLPVPAIVLILMVRSVAETAQAQESVRMSLAGAAAAQARQDAAQSPDYYNLQIGPTYWRFESGLGLQYNDNVLLGQDSRQGDFIVSPSFDTRFRWPISDKQSLNLTLGAGYWVYAQHPTLDRIFITPNSEVSFDVSAGDFLFNLHDRFSITQSTYNDPTVSGNGGYSQLQNSLGISTLWDLNKLGLKFSYDHSDYVELTGGLNQPDRTGEIFSVSAGYTLRPFMVLGLELGGGLLNNSSAGTNASYPDTTEWNVGKLQLSSVSTFSRSTRLMVLTARSQWRHEFHRGLSRFLCRAGRHPPSQPLRGLPVERRAQRQLQSVGRLGGHV